MSEPQRQAAGRMPGGRGGPFNPGRGPFGFGGPPGGFGPGSRGGPRARRGHIRAGILTLLFERPMNGYQIMQELEQRSRGVWRPSPGAVYPALQQLEDEGLVQVDNAGSGRTYALTVRGRTWVERHPERVQAPWDAMSESMPGKYLELMSHLRLISALVEQISQGGAPEQEQAADKVLRQARRELLRILAEEEKEEDPR